MKLQTPPSSEREQIITKSEMLALLFYMMTIIKPIITEQLLPSERRYLKIMVYFNKQIGDITNKLYL
jgi:hypothetical protein